MKDLNLLDIGTKVKFGEGDKFNGDITAITIREDTIKYEISYWSDADIKTLWLSRSQFITSKKSKEVKLGFGHEIQ